MPNHGGAMCGVQIVVCSNAAASQWLVLANALFLSLYSEAYIRSLQPQFATWELEVI